MASKSSVCVVCGNAVHYLNWQRGAFWKHENSTNDDHNPMPEVLFNLLASGAFVQMLLPFDVPSAHQYAKDWK